MLFNSVEYLLVFLPFVVLVSFASSRPQRVFLTAASFLFYGYWSVRFIPFLAISILLNFVCGRWLAAHPASPSTLRRAVLIVGLLFNVGLLGFFKYADFFIANLNAVAGWELGLLQLALPLGISFITFQKVAFLVDCFRGQVKRIDLLDFSLFVTFFPQLIAGPIVHHAEVIPQFGATSTLKTRYEEIATATFLVSVGLFKKVVLADSFAVYANIGHAQAASLTFVGAWETSFLYSFQLYFDFSGYTDMALGSALALGIRLPPNFLSPYKATSIQEFWRRWHVTLGRFLREYVYVPLGGGRATLARTLANLMITFLIGGIWHGAGWLFVVWGALHGLAMGVHRVWTSAGLRMPRAAGWVATFLFVDVAWVPFRANSPESALAILSTMAGANGVVLPVVLQNHLAWAGDVVSFGSWGFPASGSHGVIALIAAGAAIVFLLPNSMEWAARSPTSLFRLVTSFVFFATAYVMLGRPSAFLYWQF